MSCLVTVRMLEVFICKISTTPRPTYFKTVVVEYTYLHATRIRYKSSSVFSVKYLFECVNDQNVTFANPP